MEIKWIKITTDIFDDEKIQIIETLPESDSIIVIWFKLLVLAGKSNNNGVFMINNKIPYNDEMLAAIFRRKTTTVRLALETFQKFGMIELIDNVITIPKWEKHQNVDGLEKIREKTRQRVALYRDKQLQLTQCNAQCNVTCNADVTQSNATDIDKDIDKDIKKNNTSPSGDDEPFTDDSVPEKLKEEIPSAALANAQLLADLHKQNVDPGYKINSAYVKKWAEDIDKINRIDGRSWDDIEKVMRWCKSDPFWRSNIISGKKFREKFTQLVGKINNNHSSQPYSSSKYHEEHGVPRRIIPEQKTGDIPKGNELPEGVLF